MEKFYSDKDGGEDKIISSQMFLINRLKSEIDKLVYRLNESLKKENNKLRKENLALKAEIERLNRRLYGKNDRVLRYFERNVGAPDSDAVKR